MHNSPGPFSVTGGYAESVPETRQLRGRHCGHCVGGMGGPAQESVLRPCPDQPTPPREPPALFPLPLLSPPPPSSIGPAPPCQLRETPSPQPHQPGARDPNWPAGGQQRRQTTQNLHSKPGIRCGTVLDTYLLSKIKLIPTCPIGW